MDLFIERMPAQPIVYMRRTGAYGEENARLMAAMKSWAAARGLLEGATLYGVAHDAPDTPPERCRYDVCLAGERPADGAVLRGTLPGGRYAVFALPHTAEAVGAFWGSVFAALREAGLGLDATRPILERYRPEMLKAGLCEFCVPVPEED